MWDFLRTHLISNLCTVPVPVCTVLEIKKLPTGAGTGIKQTNLLKGRYYYTEKRT